MQRIPIAAFASQEANGAGNSLGFLMGLVLMWLNARAHALCASVSRAWQNDVVTWKGLEFLWQWRSRDEKEGRPIRDHGSDRDSWFDGLTLLRAVETEKVKIVSWLIEHGCQIDVSGTCGAAAKRGDLSLLKWLIFNARWWQPYTRTKAKAEKRLVPADAGYSRLIVRELRKKVPWWEDVVDDDTRLTNAQKLQAFLSVESLSSGVMDEAVSGGDNGVVAWLHECKLPFSTNSMKLALKHKHVLIANFLLQLGHTVGTEEINSFVGTDAEKSIQRDRIRDIAVFDWVVRLNQPHLVTLLLVNAARSGSLHLLRTYKIFLQNGSVNVRQLIQEASSGNRVEILIWLRMMFRDEFVAMKGNIVLIALQSGNKEVIDWAFGAELPFPTQEEIMEGLQEEGHYALARHLAEHYDMYVSIYLLANSFFNNLKKGGHEDPDDSDSE